MKAINEEDLPDIALHMQEITLSEGALFVFVFLCSCNLACSSKI